MWHSRNRGHSAAGPSEAAPTVGGAINGSTMGKFPSPASYGEQIIGVPPPIMERVCVLASLTRMQLLTSVTVPERVQEVWAITPSKNFRLSRVCSRCALHLALVSMDAFPP